MEGGGRIGGLGFDGGDRICRKALAPTLSRDTGRGSGVGCAPRDGGCFGGSEGAGDGGADEVFQATEFLVGPGGELFGAVAGEGADEEAATFSDPFFQAILS